MPQIHRDPTLGAVIDAIDGPTDWGEPDEPVYLSHVYFLLDADRCRVKIGYTSNLERRLADHRAAYPNIELLAAVRGNQRLEHALHRRFAPHRVSGREWYSSEIVGELPTIVD